MNARSRRADVIDRLNALPVTAVPAPGVLAFHATPHNDLTYLLHSVGKGNGDKGNGDNGDGDEGHVRPATDREIAERLGDAAVGWNLLLFGHTHIAQEAQLPSGTLVVNPGSVGMPAYDDDAPFPHVMEAGTPHARYAIVEQVAGQWQAEFRAVEYDWDAAARLAETNHRPDIAFALRTGTVRR
jgi:hypothetical protein